MTIKQKLGALIKFKKAKIPSKKNLNGKYVVLEPINIKNILKIYMQIFQKIRKIEFGYICHTVPLKAMEVLKNG